MYKQIKSDSWHSQLKRCLLGGAQFHQLAVDAHGDRSFLSARLLRLNAQDLRLDRDAFVFLWELPLRLRQVASVEILHKHQENRRRTSCLESRSVSLFFPETRADPTMYARKTRLIDIVTYVMKKACEAAVLSNWGIPTPLPAYPPPGRKNRQ